MSLGPWNDLAAAAATTAEAGTVFTAIASAEGWLCCQVRVFRSKVGLCSASIVIPVLVSGPAASAQSIIVFACCCACSLPGQPDATVSVTTKLIAPDWPATGAAAVGVLRSTVRWSARRKGRDC